MAKVRNAKVYLTDRAITDLQEIESYTTDKWSAAQAAKYLEAFERFFGLIESEPGILVPVPGIDTLLTHSVGSHVVVCTKWNGDILVLTVVHASRDLLVVLERLLPTLGFEVETMRKRLP